MTHPSFAISGFGRSGTRFLAELMDRSPTWTVRHEPSSEYHRARLIERFRREQAGGPYGECNSYLLYAIDSLPVDRVGVIIRDPLEICVSAANRGHELTDGFIEHLAASLAAIDVTLARGAAPISFALLTSDLGYLATLIRTFGVTDMAPTTADLANKVNAASRAVLPDWFSLDRASRGRIERKVRWFREQYAAAGAKRVPDPDAP
jgi:hypothetical protein